MTHSGRQARVFGPVSVLRNLAGVHSSGGSGALIPGRTHAPGSVEVLPQPARLLHDRRGGSLHERVDCWTQARRLELSLRIFRTGCTLSGRYRRSLRTPSAKRLSGPRRRGLRLKESVAQPGGTRTALLDRTRQDFCTCVDHDPHSGTR